MDSSQWVMVLIAVFTLVGSYFIARRFGDVAGTKAAIKHEEEKAAKALRLACRALAAEVERVRHLAAHNSKLLTGSGVAPPIKLPVSAFESAFFSQNAILDAAGAGADRQLLDAVLGYLTKAQAINSFIDFHLLLFGAIHRSAVGTPDWKFLEELQVRVQSDEFTKVVDSLGNQLLLKLGDLG
jgi:hypothetical protein